MFRNPQARLHNDADRPAVIAKRDQARKKMSGTELLRRLPFLCCLLALPRGGRSEIIPFDQKLEPAVSRGHRYRIGLLFLALPPSSHLAVPRIELTDPSPISFF